MIERLHRATGAAILDFWQHLRLGRFLLMLEIRQTSKNGVPTTVVGLLHNHCVIFICILSKTIFKKKPFDSISRRGCFAHVHIKTSFQELRDPVYRKHTVIEEHLAGALNAVVVFPTSVGAAAVENQTAAADAHRPLPWTTIHTDTLARARYHLWRFGADAAAAAAAAADGS